MSLFASNVVSEGVHIVVAKSHSKFEPKGVVKIVSFSVTNIVAQVVSMGVANNITKCVSNVVVTTVPIVVAKYVLLLYLMS